ncbi:hypothetical protein T440DRAFT_550939 [Plenodomus tracheiphilus IPT5]|uniref:Uncharacterized protein n=1 Tax=Plenodomus tracheiphilus IPT5 TaxID=1408161 RepID=A0A6A7BM98_9PLEO|nr:hypothetical protein T440DRAFT_550939 [Plenodomus tracheiphilus IPT5]
MAHQAQNPPHSPRSNRAKQYREPHNMENTTPLITTYIIRIPLYYRTTSYPFPPPSSQHPTTTASHIALRTTTTSDKHSLPAPHHTLKIITDVQSWGWTVQTITPTSSSSSSSSSTPATQIWLNTYTSIARHHPWEHEIWRIWQREHGFRIRHRDEAFKSEGRAGMAMMTPKQRVIQRLRNLGRWFDMRRHGEGMEWQLRRAEARRESSNIARRRAMAEGTGGGGENVDAGSLRDSVEERLQGLGTMRRVGVAPLEDVDGGEKNGKGERRASVACLQYSHDVIGAEMGDMRSVGSLG